MFFTKSTKDYVMQVYYNSNSGWFTVEHIEVLSKDMKEIDCKKVAERQLKKYKKDMKFFYEDLEEFGSILQKSQIINGE